MPQDSFFVAVLTMVALCCFRVDDIVKQPVLEIVADVPVPSFEAQLATTLEIVAGAPVSYFEADNTSLWCNTTSEERVRKYLSIVYHQDVGQVPGWRAKWNEVELLYPCVGVLKAEDFPPDGRRQRWSRGFEVRGHAFWTHVPATRLRRRLYGNGSWVEVARTARPEGEGVAWARACWFFVHPGSGVWINVGKTAVFDMDHEATAKKIKAEFPSVKFSSWGDGVFWLYAKLKGLDTVQTAFSKDWDGNGPELLYLSGVCNSTKIKTGCIHGLEFRTGLRHDLPCNCSDKNRGLNCDLTNSAGRGSRATGAPPGKVLRCPP